MGWTIIVASSDADQLAELKNGAMEIEVRIRSSEGSARVLEATCIEDIKTLRKDPHDIQTELVILTASLSESRSAPDSQNLPGLNFVKQLQASASPPACILVSELPELWGEVRGMKRCKWLPVGASTNYIDDCALLAKELDVWAPSAESQTPHGSDIIVYEASPLSAPYALIEVDLPNEARHATVRRVVRYANGIVNSTPTSALELNQRKVDELVNDSRTLSARFSKALKSPRKYLKWQTDYRALGERFFKLLNTEAFAKQLNFAEGATAGQDVRLRFSLGRLVFDGLWESICDPAGRHLRGGTETPSIISRADEAAALASSMSSLLERSWMRIRRRMGRMMFFGKSFGLGPGSKPCRT
jgi:hypothetical protein